jgi:hypothetical protein
MPHGSSGRRYFNGSTTALCPDVAMSTAVCRCLFLSPRSAPLEQRLDDLAVARRTGKHQRRIALLVAQIGRGTAFNERAYHLE